MMTREVCPKSESGKLRGINEFISSVIPYMSLSEEDTGSRFHVSFIDVKDSELHSFVAIQNDNAQLI